MSAATHYYSVVLGYFIAVKRHCDHGKSYKKNLMGKVACLQFRGSVYYLHGREHGGMQADVVLELRVLHLDS